MIIYADFRHRYISLHILTQNAANTNTVMLITSDSQIKCKIRTKRS